MNGPLNEHKTCRQVSYTTFPHIVLSLQRTKLYYTVHETKTKQNKKIGKLLILDATYIFFYKSENKHDWKYNLYVCL